MHKSSTNIVRTDFAAAINQIVKEKKIEPESIYEAIRLALVSAYRKQYGAEENSHYYAELNTETGESRLWRAPVLTRDEETEEPLTWDEAQAEDVTPAGFGRIAAQTAKQVILQKIRESEKENIIAEYQSKIGEIISAQILRMDGRKVILDLGRGYAQMPPEEQMRGEFYRVNSRITVYIKEIRETFKGQVIIVSRAAPELVAQLFAREVPEVGAGAVEIARIAREAGVRTKLAVRSTQDGVDPVGACVGQRGVRVQEVIRELNNEKLDIIPYSDNFNLLVQAALAPAEGLKIEIDEKRHLITVFAPEDQLTLVIGRGGQNARLAAKLLQYGITVKSLDGQVKSKVTGQEEYEIDSFPTLTPETRALLVEHKLTTLSDLARFKTKWQDFELASDQVAFLTEKVDAFEAEQALREKQHLESAKSE